MDKLPYGGMTRIRFKGCISLLNSVSETPSNTPKLREKPCKSKR